MNPNLPIHTLNTYRKQAIGTPFIYLLSGRFASLMVRDTPQMDFFAPYIFF